MSACLELPPDRPGEEEGVADFLVRHYGPHAEQRAFIASPAPYKAAVAGLGGGKTEAGACDVVSWCLWRPGIRWLVVAPTYRMLYRSTYRTIQKVARWWGAAVETKFLSSENRLIICPNRLGPHGEPSEVLFGHCQDEDSLRAVEVARAWVDEAALCTEEAFLVVMGRCRQPGYSHGVSITTTPKGRNWVYRRWVLEREHWAPEQQRDWAIFNWRTADNPLYVTEPQYLDALRGSYGEGTDWARQELDAEFVSFRGQVYRMFDRRRHVIGEAPPREALFRVVGGIDWGVSSPGCMVVIGEDIEGRAYILEEVYERDRAIIGEPGNDWLATANDLQKRWRVERWYADPEDANAIRGFRRDGLPIHGADNRRVPGVREVSGRLASDRLYIVGPECPNVLAEIEQYHWRETADGNPLEDQDPAKEFDHSMDAVRYAIMGMRRRAA